MNCSKRVMSAFIGASLLFAGSANAVVNFTLPVDAPALTPGVWNVLDVRNNGGLNNQNDARASLNSVTGTRTLGTINAVNIFNDGNIGSNEPMPGGAQSDNVAALFRANVFAPVAGIYTVNVRSDDGFTLAVNGGTNAFSGLYNQNGGNPGIIDTYNGNANGALTFFGGRPAEDTGAQVFLNQGSHTFDLTYHQGGGGAGLEVTAAFGAHTSSNSNFSLINNTPSPSVIIPGIVGPITMEAVNGLPSQNIASAKAHIASNVGPTSQSTVINHRDPDNGTCCGGFNNGSMIAFPNNTAGDNNDFATQSVGTLFMPAAGEVIIHVRSDDGFSFQIDGAQWTVISSAGNNATVQNGGEELVFDQGTGNSNVIAKLLLGAGNHNFALTHWDGGGGSYIQVYLGATANDQGGLLLGSVDASVGTTPRLSLLNEIVTIPEPASVLLGLMGVLSLGARRRRVA